MTNFIPIFPLGVVVYPGEQLNLHIFEPRYKQLIRECMDAQKPFGIPTVMDDQMMEFGTLVEITLIKQVYEDGKMDIITRGLQVFRLLEVVKDIPDKLYNGAIVNYPDNESESVHPGMASIVQAIRELHQLLQVEKSFPRSDNALRSYDVAHLAGMSLQEEYELLQLFREDQRVEYLKRHLHKVLPVVKEMETLKERVKLNGHFRELRSLGFE